MKTKMVQALYAGVCCAGFLSIGMTSAAENGAAINSAAIELDLPILHLVDGSAAMNSAMARFMSTAAKLRQIRHGKGGDHKGIIELKGEFHTLDALVAMEKELMGKYGKKFDVRWPESPLRDALENVVEQIKKITADYTRELTNYRDAIVTVIEKWAARRGKSNTLLVAWGRAGGNTDKFIKKSLVSLVAVDAFINDLMLMLADIRKTCKRSNAHVEEILLKIKNAKK